MEESLRPGGGGDQFGVWWLRRMMRLRRRAGPVRSSDPLFVVSGAPLRAEMMGSFVKCMVRAAGGDDARVGTHGLRRGGATTALAAGVDPETIRMLGRWDSGVYQIYAQRSRCAAMRLGAVIASSSF